jgi:hypothetical protein
MNLIFAFLLLALEFPLENPAFYFYIILEGLKAWEICLAVSLYICIWGKSLLGHLCMTCLLFSSGPCHKYRDSDLISPRSLLSKSIPILCSYIIRSLDTTYSEPLTQSSNKPRRDSSPITSHVLLPLRSDSFNILWHADTLLRNDREINNYTTAITRQQPINSNRGAVFSVQSVPRCYTQDKLGAAVS